MAHWHKGCKHGWERTFGPLPPHRWGWLSAPDNRNEVPPVLPISPPMKRGSVRYYNNTAKAAGAAMKDRQKAGGGLGEYYTEGDTRAPRWIGVGDREKLSELTGLSTGQLAGGEADMDTVERWLDDGIAPNGATGRAYNKDSTHGFDLTFGAPKSVSLLRRYPPMTCSSKHSPRPTTPPCDAAMEYLNDHVGYTRVHNPITGKKDLVRLPGLVAAAYQHETSRAGDPHLHTHVLLFNNQARSDGEMVSDRQQVAAPRSPRRRHDVSSHPAPRNAPMAGHRMGRRSTPTAAWPTSRASPET